MSAKPPKPKFIPPLKTAASFLRTVSRSPDFTIHSSVKPNIFKEHTPEPPSNRLLNTFTRESGAFSERVPGCFSPKITSDAFFMRDTFKSSSQSPEHRAKTQTFWILPTQPEHLRTLLKASSKLNTRKKSERGKLCIKEKCLETLIETENSGEKDLAEEYQKANYDIQHIGINQEVTGLIDWLKYMREQHLNKIIQDENAYKSMPKDELKGVLDMFDLVLRAGGQECIRQVSKHCADHGDIVSDLLSYRHLYWKAKTFHSKYVYESTIADLEKKIAALKDSFEAQSKDLTSKAEILAQELNLYRSNHMIKEVEISKSKEHIKKLKAERTFRIKKEFESYNLLLKKFKEYRELARTKNDDKQIIRAINKKRDSIKEIILGRLDLLMEKKNATGIRLTEEQLIEHEMLSTNTDFIFIDCGTQADVKAEVLDKSINAVPESKEAEAETDEILELIEIEENQEISDPPQQPFSIFVTNEKEEELAAYSNLINKLDEISLNDTQKAQGNSDDNLGPNVKKAKFTKRIKKNSGFRWRLQFDKNTQTEDKIFLQVAKAEEEEILDWMLKDRKDYLRGVQRKIFHKKNELSKVSNLINKSKSLLGESINLEDSKLQTSFVSIENPIEDMIENEVGYLKEVGLLNSETEIETWKNGYYYGYEKGKCDAIVTAEEFLEDDKECIDRLPDEIIDDHQLPDAIYIEQASDSDEEFNPVKKSLSIAVDIKPTRRGTKIQEFNFQKKNSKNLNKTKYKRPKFLGEFLEEPSRLIMKQAKMSRKMTVKMIASIYSAAVIKKHSMEISDLARFTHDEFCARFGLKTVISKKLTDFLSSILKYPDTRKTVNFSRLIGISQKIGLEDYVRPRETFKILIDVMDLLQKSNLGNVVSFDESMDYEFIPSIRAVECTKEVMSKYLDPLKVQIIIGNIEKNSHADPKKINKSGIIDQEFLQEILLNEYDAYCQAMLKNIWIVFEGFYFSTAIFKVYKHDFVMIARFFSPGKSQSLFPAPEMDSFNKLMSHNVNKQTISVKKILTLCFSNGVLALKDMENGMPKLVSYEVLDEEICEQGEKVVEMLEGMKKGREKLGFSEQYCEEWFFRYKALKENKEVPLLSLFVMWRILKAEIYRLASIFDF